MRKGMVFTPTVKMEDSKIQYSKVITLGKTQKFYDGYSQSITESKSVRGKPLVKGKYEMIDY